MTQQREAKALSLLWSIFQGGRRRMMKNVWGFCVVLSQLEQFNGVKRKAWLRLVQGQCTCEVGINLLGNVPLGNMYQSVSTDASILGLLPGCFSSCDASDHDDLLSTLAKARREGPFLLGSRFKRQPKGQRRVVFISSSANKPQGAKKRSQGGQIKRAFTMCLSERRCAFC